MSKAFYAAFVPWLLFTVIITVCFVGALLGFDIRVSQLAALFGNAWLMNTIFWVLTWVLDEELNDHEE